MKGTTTSFLHGCSSAGIIIMSTKNSKGEAVRRHLLFQRGSMINCSEPTAKTTAGAHFIDTTIENELSRIK